MGRGLNCCFSSGLVSVSVVAWVVGGMVIAVARFAVPDICALTQSGEVSFQIVERKLPRSETFSSRKEQ